MRRLALVLMMMAAVLLLGCGGHHVPPAGTGIAANLALSPTTLSLTGGDVGNVTSSMTDKFNSIVTNPPPVIYSSSNTALVNISPGGLVCAGTWDANYIVCTPGGYGNAVITATVNVKATPNTPAATLTATLPVYVHPRVDRVVVSPAVVNCVSSGGQQQLLAQAYSAGNDVTSLVGPPNWIVASTSVASVDSASVAAARQPGRTSISASVAGVNSLPISFTTCPVARIQLHTVGSSGTSATLSKGGTAPVQVDVFDSNGVALPVTSIGPSFINSQPVSTSFSATQITALSPPGVGELGVACTPSLGCNTGIGPVYSNQFRVTVSGTDNPGVLAAGTGTTSIVPIDTAANTAGTPVTLSYTPNSLVVNQLGQTGLLGTSSQLLQYQTGNNSFSQVTDTPGTILAAAPDNSSALVYDASRNTLYMASVGTSGAGSAASYQLSGSPVTAAAFSPDGGLAVAVAGNTLYPFFRSGGWLLSPAITLSAPAGAVAYLPSGQFLYLAGGSASAVTVLATFDNSQADVVAVPATPLLLGALPDSSQVLAVDNTGLDVLVPSSTLAGLPPTVSHTVTRVDFGATVTPRQLIVTPDSAHAIIVTDQNQLLVYTASTMTIAPITIANGATCFSGGSSTEGTRVWLGCSDNAVHRFDLASMTDASQLQVSFTPDLVAIVPK